jgi:hypothetical protein
VTGADVCTLDVALSAFLEERAPDIFSDIVSYQIKGDPIPAAEISERSSYIISGPKREHVAPFRNNIVVSLSIGKF